MSFLLLGIRDKPLLSKGVLILKRMLEGVTPNFVNLQAFSSKLYFRSSYYSGFDPTRLKLVGLSTIREFFS